MKTELKNLVNEIIKDTRTDNSHKSIRLINLAENAFNYGDINAYQEIFTIVQQLNPEIGNQNFKSININKINHKPLEDIDLSTEPDSE